MPISTAQLQQLKRTNISQDPEKTKQRVTELWQGLKIKQKQAIRELADITAQPVYRTQETGTISARLTLAFAQSLNVSPFYLTGEVDVPGEFSDEAMRDLLQKHGYSALLAEMQPMERQKRPYTRRQKIEEVPEGWVKVEIAPDGTADTTATVVTEEIVKADEPIVPKLQLPPGSEALTAEDLQQLVFALYVQAKAGIPGSKEKLDQIKLVIFS